MELNLDPAKGRTVWTPLPGSNRWWDKLPKDEKEGWPLVICFETKADRDAFVKYLRS